MKDLYLRLGLETDAGREAIEQAARSSGDSEAVATILLSDKRRAAYNHCHATLTAIGNLRKRLKLDDEDNWFTEECADFVPRKKPPPPPQQNADGHEMPAQRMAENLARAAHEEAPADSGERMLTLPVIIVIALGVAIAAWFIFR